MHSMCVWSGTVFFLFFFSSLSGRTTRWLSVYLRKEEKLAEMRAQFKDGYLVYYCNVCFMFSSRETLSVGFNVFLCPVSFTWPHRKRWHHMTMSQLLCVSQRSTTPPKHSKYLRHAVMAHFSKLPLAHESVFLIALVRTHTHTVGVCVEF